MSIFSYIGPGAGLGLIGALLGVLGTAAGAVMMVAAHPIRKAWQARKGNKGNKDNTGNKGGKNTNQAVATENEVGQPNDQHAV